MSLREKDDEIKSFAVKYLSIKALKGLDYKAEGFQQKNFFEKNTG